jgi:hypothetical protein
MTLSKWCLVLFVAGLVPGIYHLYHPVGLGLGPGFEMPTIARNLVESGTYGDSFESLKTGPTANNPPLYPLFLALCIRLFRTPAPIILAILAANIIVNALVPALLPRVSLILFDNAMPGIAGGALSIAASWLIPSWDADYTQLGLVAFCLMTMRLVRGRGYNAWTGAIAGAALGILFLLSQVVLLVALPWIGYLLLTQRTQWRTISSFLTTMLLAAILVNLPWLLRNYGIWGEFVTRTNFGFTLHTSNNDCAAPSIDDEIANGCYAATHPEKSVAEAALLQSMGEPAYDRLKTAQALSWIRTHRDRFVRLTLARIVQFWFPPPVIPRYAAYAIWIITLLSIPGFVLMLIRKVPAALYLGAVFLLYPLLYYIVVSAIRYRVPILWLSSLAAGYFLTALPFRRRS